ncbi:hypothetical protein [Nitrococcus mobilis]|uniref:Uncharacterized protein n=1 Tax=Nitrococcus mobilis Nb-231 TaxID=314278 RepID=A4BPB4_9GAMM|nr:hypothetical protein [Nitrococcus mobilis]EAR22415.1 hypothetical protein NB231_11784 [Nitrococcus mobilis Nb-231]
MAKLDLSTQPSQKEAQLKSNSKLPQITEQVSLCIMVTPKQRREIKSYAASLGLTNKELILRAIEAFRHD